MDVTEFTSAIEQAVLDADEMPLIHSCRAAATRFSGAAKTPDRSWYRSG
jgi:hypothetical protein